MLQRWPAAEIWLAAGACSEADAPGQARRCYRQARAAAPVEAAYRLGRLAQAQGDFVAALQAWGDCLRLQPDFGPAAARLAGLFAGLEQYQAAIPCYLKALEASPGDENLYLGLAEALDEQGDLDAVLTCLQSLCLMHPELLGMISFYLGFLLEKRGDFAAALLCYDQALATAAVPAWQLKRELAFPMVMDSRAEIETCHARIASALDTALLSWRRAGAAEALGRQAFEAIALNLAHLAYHHPSPLPLRRKFAALLSRMLPPVELEPLVTGSGPLHLGVVLSAQLNLPLLYIGGLLNQLDPEAFRVTIFCPSLNLRLIFAPEHPAHLRRRVETCLLSPDAAAAARQIQRAGCDALWLAEPSWDALQYRLGLQRLAPVQFTHWINPGSTGLPQLDYYLSSALIEPAAAQADYSETLVRCATLPVYFPAISLPPHTLSAADFGLPAAARLYLCPHSLLKFHPDFDALLAGILRADPLGQIVLIAFRGQETLAQQLAARFGRHLPDVCARIWFLPYLERETFFNLLYCGQVLLDPLYYGGGTILYQAFACALPIVTLPGERILSRIALGCYRRLGDFSECLAADPGDYVRRAVRIAGDPGLQSELRQRLKQTAGRLFNDPAAPVAFADFLRQATGRV